MADDDRDVLEATGKHPDEWFAYLDAHGAIEWDHARIVAWLIAEAPNLSEQWGDAIATRYEQARGTTAVPEA